MAKGLVGRHEVKDAFTVLAFSLDLYIYSLSGPSVSFYDRSPTILDAGDAAMNKTGKSIVLLGFLFQ